MSGPPPAPIAPATPSREMAFEFVEGATADLAFVARGPTVEAVFRAAAEALLAAAVEEPARVGVAPGAGRRIELEEPELDLLLLRFLNELIYLRDAKGLLLRPTELGVERGSGQGVRLRAELAGESIAGHAPAADVKAATAHALAVRETATGWEAEVTLDV